MQSRVGRLGLLLATSLFANTVSSATQFRLDKTINLSSGTGAPAAENAASKGKIVRLTDGTLVSVYADALDANY